MWRGPWRKDGPWRRERKRKRMLQQVRKQSTWLSDWVYALMSDLLSRSYIMARHLVPKPLTLQCIYLKCFSFLAGIYFFSTFHMFSLGFRWGKAIPKPQLQPDLVIPLPLSMCVRDRCPVGRPNCTWNPIFWLMILGNPQSSLIHLLFLANQILWQQNILTA